jgi:acetyl esterase
MKHVFNQQSETADPRMELVDANLASLPPITIIAAEIEPPRSVDKLLAERLEQACVEVDYQCYSAAAQSRVAMAFKKGAPPRFGREARGRAQLMEAKHG